MAGNDQVLEITEAQWLTLQRQDPDTEGWCGAGWYFRDPDNQVRFVGPFHTRRAADLAWSCYVDSCGGHMNWPCLHLVLDLGFLSLRTSVMYERYETQTKEWIALDWRFFKWNGSFRLYTPWDRRDTT